MLGDLFSTVGEDAGCQCLSTASGDAGRYCLSTVGENASRYSSIEKFSTVEYDFQKVETFCRRAPLKRRRC